MAFMDDISKKNKLNSQISDKEREINKLYAQIGQQYYFLHKDNAEPELAAMVKAVAEAKEVIQLSQERLDFANGVTQCPSCGKKTEISAQFCNGCGSRIPTPRRIIPTPEGNICIQCGTLLKDGQKFCVGCGTRLVIEPVAPAAAEPYQAQPVNAAPPVMQTPPITQAPPIVPVVETPPVVEAPPVVEMPPIAEQAPVEAPVEVVPMPAFVPVEEAKKTCQKCGAQMSDEQLFCVVCGTKAEAAPVKEEAPAGKTCAKCGAAMEDDQVFCVMCGTRAGEEARKNLCPNCGKELLDGAAFCIGCGTKL